jgi:hypothetical protein
MYNFYGPYQQVTNKDYSDFIGKLSKIKGVSEVTAIAAKNDVDY